MAGLLYPLETRLVAILEASYGTSRTITLGWFRRSADRLSLTDPGYPRQKFDGAYELQFGDIADHERDAPSNPNDPWWLLDVTVALRIGFVEGVGAAGAWNPSAAGTGETASWATQNARRRALERSQAVWRAINTNARDTSSDPQTVDVRRVGKVALDDLGDGRLVATTTLVAWLAALPGSEYAPTE